MISLRDYVERRREFFSGAGHLIAAWRDSVFLANAVAMQPVSIGNLAWGKQGQCYCNAALEALANPDLFTYVEGLAKLPRSGIALDHAWLADKAGHALDTTWREPGTEYFGIPVSAERLRSELLRSRVYGLFDRGRGINVEFFKSIAPADLPFPQLEK